MAELGDMIEIIREKFSHWGLYVGRGYIIHLTVDGVTRKEVISGICASTGSVNSAIATVKKEKLTDVAKGDTWMVKNHLDKKYNTKSPDDIVKEAKQQVGKKMPYNLLTNNCEHFVTNLRYGKPQCRQVLKVMVARVKGSICS